MHKVTDEARDSDLEESVNIEICQTKAALNFEVYLNLFHLSSAYLLIAQFWSESTAWIILNRMKVVTWGVELRKIHFTLIWGKTNKSEDF